MTRREARWWIVRAGEYVLGTLRGDDLARFEHVLEHDAEMRAEVRRWERRLVALNASTPARAPGDHVWRAIVERVRVSGATERSRGNARTSRAFTAGRAPAEARRASRAPSPWQGALAGAALAAGVVLGILLAPRADPLGGGMALRVDGVSVVESDASGTPLFYVETDHESLRVRVTALAPPSIAGDRNFQLWQALPDRSAVRALVPLPEEAGASRTWDVRSLVDGSDLFGVSVEPDGAPTDAGPTGPVIAHGDWLRRRPER